jgi:hypothetical protein
MSNLADYYRDLLNWEGVPFQVLVEAWPSTLIDEIKTDFAAAVNASNIKHTSCPIRDGSSNQSIGNQVEEFTIRQLESHSSAFTITACSGAGYPDRVLVRRACLKKIALEFKATSDWNPSDSNRRVLTSSSEKIRKCFVPPIHHLLCTVLYRIGSNTADIHGIRLDFLEPNTAVNVRLEASVNHKILATGSHSYILL